MNENGKKRTKHDAAKTGIEDPPEKNVMDAAMNICEFKGREAGEDDKQQDRIYKPPHRYTTIRPHKYPLRVRFNVDIRASRQTAIWPMPIATKNR